MKKRTKSPRNFFSPFFTVLLAVFGVATILILWQSYKIYAVTGKVSYTMKPYTHVLPDAKMKFLFVGDSTAVGTGSRDNTQSVAGRFGQAFPKASIENFGVNGKRLSQLLKEFPPTQKHYRLVVVQIGGNDIMKLTPYASVKKNISMIVDRAKLIGDHVVILHSGNVGIAPIFVWPFDDILSARSRAVRLIYMKTAKEKGAHYIDLYTERNNDLFLKNVEKYYSSDLLHPSGDGYGWWYQRVRETLDEAGVKL